MRAHGKFRGVGIALAYGLGDGLMLCQRAKPARARDGFLVLLAQVAQALQDSGQGDATVAPAEQL